MGYFWQGLPPYVIDWAQALLPPGSTAVETGTFQGDTSSLLAQRFGSCVTIERSSSLAAAARRRFAADGRVTVVEGTSRDLLADVLPPADVGCFFWLDAHGFYDYVGDDKDENPLLAELEAILAARGQGPNVIAVDDARGMGTQPDWPPLHQIFTVLAAHGYLGAIVDDTLVAASERSQPDFYALYKASRQVEVPAVFHIWPQIRGLARLRQGTDGLITTLRQQRRR